MDSRRMTTEEFKEELFGINYKIRVVGEYTKANDRIKVQCKTCNHTWNAIPASLRLGVGCPKCAGVLQLTHDQFVARLRVLQPDLIPLTEYINTKEKVVVKCKVCGYVWSTQPYIILLQHLQDKERDVRNVRAGAGELRMNLLRRSQICHLQLKSLERLLVEINLYWCNVPNVIGFGTHGRGVY